MLTKTNSTTKKIATATGMGGVSLLFLYNLYADIDKRVRVTEVTTSKCELGIEYIKEQLKRIDSKLDYIKKVD